MDNRYDIIIIGTGAGGGTLAYALKDSGLKVLILERGDNLPQEPENWSARATFTEKRYKAKEKWYDEQGKPFAPGVNYYVGGNTKVYGAVMFRLRKEDFKEIEHEGGRISPAWPISYDDLEPYYARAEELYLVHGKTGEDSTDPPRSSPFPFPAVSHEPTIETLSVSLKKQGLHPSHLPMAVDLREGGRCIRCKTCDGFPCKVHAKGDADVCCVQPALKSSNVTMMTNAYARRILTDESGSKAKAVEYERDGKIHTVGADTIVVSCGAVNSAALLLRSANGKHPEGLANQSGLVGRNYMMHINTGLVALRHKENTTIFQKTLTINDFYFGTRDFPYPMGNLQMLGKLQGPMMKDAKPFVPDIILNGVAKRSVDWFVMTEDLPHAENRVTLTKDGQIQVSWKPNNTVAHKKLIEEAKKMMRHAGYPIVVAQPMGGIETNSHQCGTICFGNDPDTSVLDQFCRSHTVKNLYVVDASFFPSSAAVNPALTIAAQALRVADHMLQKKSMPASDEVYV
ncbi:choline dehydrogenase-like flavoprotein [Scopulibacillus darangshiensis]|uniref:Choline dehydrogenase-like flavoprotein n=1 Tax=Scopulibacillus darangshiensis TaxID=442528 RepID=A0A4R2NZT0_9BACL|nr:GMC family oxidoreductase [Scopulibacillus darangshiensis]TCP27830.1 choline dehydrogenase-like flavoprotein [Scopulibacillus darangshiensis]